MLCDPTRFICAFIEVLLPRSSLMSMRLPKRSLRSVRCKKLAKLFKPKHSAPLRQGIHACPWWKPMTGSAISAIGSVAKLKANTAITGRDGPSDSERDPKRPVMSAAWPRMSSFGNSNLSLANHVHSFDTLNRPPGRVK